jgi:hypothetical protein
MIRANAVNGEFPQQPAVRLRTDETPPKSGAWLTTLRGQNGPNG